MHAVVLAPNGNVAAVGAHLDMDDIAVLSDLGHLARQAVRPVGPDQDNCGLPVYQEKVSGQ